MIEGFANGQDMSENGQRASAATRNAIKLLTASAMLGGQGVDAAIDRAAIGVAGETYVRAEHSRQKMVALGALRPLARAADFAAAAALRAAESAPKRSDWRDEEVDAETFAAAATSARVACAGGGDTAALRGSAELIASQPRRSRRESHAAAAATPPRCGGQRSSSPGNVSNAVSAQTQAGRAVRWVDPPPGRCNRCHACGAATAWKMRATSPLSPNAA